VLTKLLLAFTVMAGCVVIHTSGVTWALRRLVRERDAGQQFWALTWTCIRLAALMVLCHLVEIVLWGLLYLAAAALPDPHAAFYFSAVTYTTTGYGDLVLPPEWRLVGGIEALTGILMSGWSTAFFFAVLSGMYASRSRD
jgi:hypothetical protein